MCSDYKMKLGECIANGQIKSPSSTDRKVYIVVVDHLQHLLAVCRNSDGGVDK